MIAWMTAGAVLVALWIVTVILVGVRFDLPTSQTFNQYLTIQSAGFPISVNATGTLVTVNPVDRTICRRVIFIITMGVNTATASVSAQVQQCATSGGIYAAVGNPTTGVTLSAQQVAIEVDLDNVQITQRYVNCLVTVTGGTSSVLAITTIALARGLKQATAYDDASVVQRIVLPTPPLP